MQAKMHMWIQLLAYLYITTVQSEFMECPGNSLTVLPDASDIALTCGGYSGTATWSFEKSGASTTPIGTCVATCTPTPGFGTFFILAALSSSSSRLNLTALATGTTFGVTKYTCETNICTITMLEPTTEPPPTTTPTTTSTPGPIHHCKCCECSNCKDTGGCWICILLIVIIIVCLVILCISIYCCCCCCFCYWCCREKTEQRLGRIYKRIDRNLGKTPKGTSDNQDEGTRMAESADKPTNPNSLPGSTEQPTIPNSTKRGKQTAEKSDMNELRDIPSSPDQDERLHPAKGSRDLPQPRGGGGGQVNVTHSNTPRSLLPVQAVTPLPSVERNSYAESRKLPLPSIDSKDAH